VNTSETNTLKVVCPIVLNIENTNEISDVTVNVIDGHSTKDVKCRLKVGSSDSPILSYGSTRSTTGQSRDLQTLSFSDIALTFSGKKRVIAIMHCELPEKDNYYVVYIRSYSAGVR
jgi:hypothetical protein